MFHNHPDFLSGQIVMCVPMTMERGRYGCGFLFCNQVEDIRRHCLRAEFINQSLSVQQLHEVFTMYYCFSFNIFKSLDEFDVNVSSHCFILKRIKAGRVLRTDLWLCLARSNQGRSEDWILRRLRDEQEDKSINKYLYGWCVPHTGWSREGISCQIESQVNLLESLRQQIIIWNHSNSFGFSFVQMLA